VAGLLSVRGYRPIMVYAVYMISGGGLAEGNTELLSALGRHRSSHAHLSLLGGDWNLDPSRLAESGFPSVAGLDFAVADRKIGSYVDAHGISTIDYFLLDEELRMGLKVVEAIFTTDVAEHRPVQLTFHSKLVSKMVLRMCRPAKIPTYPCVGPRRKSKGETLMAPSTRCGTPSRTGTASPPRRETTRCTGH
jgi:hypothetical protein